MNKETDNILGVDREILERFLVLVRDKYDVAAYANYFLEHQVGIGGTTIGITNLRDVLSHLASMLGGAHNKAPLDIEDQKAQLSNAEEHFRRAVYEPYEHAANERVLALDQEIERYKKIVLKKGSTYIERKKFVSRQQIEGRMTSIRNLRDQARSAKSINLWNKQWEESVKKQIEVNEALNNFINDLEKMSNEVEAEKGLVLGREGLWLAIIGVIIGVIGIVAGYYIALYFYKKGG